MATRLTLLSLFTCTLLVAGCDDSPTTPSNNATDLSHLYTYVKQAREAPLQDPASCVNYSRNCSIEALPFIAQQFPETQISDIMSRVVVSHDWMGDRFASLLPLLPKEILTLLGSVTAVVIADNIRPSFYWTGSGAIYLDAASLWLSNEEKQSIDQTPDYREDLGKQLSYDFFHRFVKQGQPAYRNYSLSDNEQRSIEDIVIPMASLLLHELAHANDFMPVSLMSSLDMNQPVWSEINRLSAQRLNRQLSLRYPIVDNTLIAHAKILYKGDPATEAEIADSAGELGELMAQEGANHLYAYSHQAEDVAMLFQATLLNYYYDIEMDSAFVIQPDTKSNYCDDYLVGWGQRNRIGDPLSKPRAQFVSEQLLPAIDLTVFFEQLPDAQKFPDGTDWCNIALSESSLRNSTQNKNHNTQKNRMQRNHHHGVITTYY